VAEIRSFLIGAVVAGIFLGIVAVALGAFDSESQATPTARLLGGTPPASPTPRPSGSTAVTPIPTTAPTRAPVSPTAAATNTQAAEPSPTSGPTNTPVPQPTVNPIDAYVNSASPVVSDLVAQITYVAGQGSNNPAGSTQAANTIKALAARLQGISPPACLASAHGTLTQGASAASLGADQLLAALSSNNSAAVQTAISNLNAASGTLNQGANAIRNANC
jgi:hypothetical protein